MRLFCHLVAVLLLIASGTVADGEFRSAIISFDDPATPISALSMVEDLITKAGGNITHVYSIIRYALMPCSFSRPIIDKHSRAVAVVASRDALEKVRQLNTGYNLRVEDDEIMRTQSGV